jgi:hypothetical protein
MGQVPWGMRMVLLRHELPDGKWHFDWMIETPDRGRGLVTFRVGVRVDAAEITQFDGERMGMHRPEYLTYEGPVSGGRGVVRRVAEGLVAEVVDREGEIEVRGDFGGCAGVWHGTQRGALWRFERT